MQTFLYRLSSNKIHEINSTTHIPQTSLANINAQLVNRLNSIKRWFNSHEIFIFQKI